MKKQRKALLYERSKMLHQVRSFFFQRQVKEVDCPALSLYPCVDLNIESIEVDGGQGEKRYLHTSPEYGIKRLLVEGMGDCYQLSHVFRKGEAGQLHNPEFTMIEWYRMGWTLDQLIEETVALCSLFLGSLPIKIASYSQLYMNFCSIDPFSVTREKLIALVKKKKGVFDYDNERSEVLLDYLWMQCIEPKLKREECCCVIDFPAEQAALAKVKEKEGKKVADRFEIYCRGTELANGYNELLDPEEHRIRFAQTNRERKKQKKNPLKEDERFLQALERGMPQCCGVAVGFDRLLMLQQNVNCIRDIIPFSWQEA